MARKDVTKNIEAKGFSWKEGILDFLICDSLNNFHGG